MNDEQRVQYAEAADHCASTAVVWQTEWPERFRSMELAARVLRALASGEWRLVPGESNASIEQEMDKAYQCGCEWPAIYRAAIAAAPDLTPEKGGEG